MKRVLTQQILSEILQGYARRNTRLQDYNSFSTFMNLKIK